MGYHERKISDSVQSAWPESSLEEAADAMDRDGVVKIPGLLSPEEVEGLRAALERQVRSHGVSRTLYDLQDLSDQIWDEGGVRDTKGADRFDAVGIGALVRHDPQARNLSMDGPRTEEGHFFYEVAGWRVHPEIRQAAFRSALPAVTARLLDSQELFFWEDTTFIKTPGARLRTPFHQDYTYFQISGRQCLIAWIALDTINKANGAMEYVRGSHRWGSLFAPNVFVSQTTFPGAEGDRLPDIDANPGDYDIVSFDVEPGDVIFHHCLTVHGAGHNGTSHANRRAISLRYCGDDIRYYDRPGSLPQPGLGRALKTGDRLGGPDYPKVWPLSPEQQAQKEKYYSERAEAWSMMVHGAAL